MTGQIGSNVRDAAQASPVLVDIQLTAAFAHLSLVETTVHETLNKIQLYNHVNKLTLNCNEVFTTAASHWVPASDLLSALYSGCRCGCDTVQPSVSQPCDWLAAWSPGCELPFALHVWPKKNNSEWNPFIFIYLGVKWGGGDSSLASVHLILCGHAKYELKI